MLSAPCARRGTSSIRRDPRPILSPPSAGPLMHNSRPLQSKGSRVIHNQRHSSVSVLEQRLALSFFSRKMRNNTVVVITGFTLVAFVCPFNSVRGAAPITLQVEAFHGLPSLHHSELSRFLAARMADTGLPDWRFEPAQGDIAAPNRVEWTFRLNPHAGGEVRRFGRAPVAEQGFSEHRPVTIEVRLYLNGEYQTLVEQQSMIQGDPNDSDFAAGVASATMSLLGPSGAYRAIDIGLHPSPRAR
jgi:hypothetical protein